MHRLVSFDHKIIASDETSISALSSAALHGKGIFTTVSIYDGQAFLWKKHWRRLTANAEKLDLDISEFSETNIKRSLLEIIQANNCNEGRARITFFDESQSSIWPFETTRKTSLLITTGENRRHSDKIRVTVSPYTVNSRSPLASVKSCNYLDRILVLDEARSRGFDETTQANERGEITSAAMANVFWLSDGVLYTPSLRTGCLAGTTREFVLENIDCREVEVGIEALDDAEAIFLTSAGIGVVQVAEFEARRLEKVDHPILHLLPY